MMKRIIQRLLLLPNPFDQGSNNFWRVRIFSTYLILTLLVFGFFAVYNFAVVERYGNGTVDLIGLLLGVLTVADYRINRKVERTSWFVVLNVMLMSVAIILISTKDYGILMWSIFTPIFAFFLLGLRRGLQITLVYYAILVVHLFSVLGTQVSSQLLLEFVAVSLSLCGVIYYYELNREITYEMIHRASMEDVLTGLHNRRWFNKRFDSEYQRARRDQRPFCFFIMDIDRFKRYNDTNGHDMGDEVLRRVAQVLIDSMRRSGDEVFRLGGEEFGGIINSDSEEEALAHVESIRLNIEKLNIAIVPETGQVVTASFGLSTTMPSEHIRTTEIYRLTDQALYRAKEKGRNRVEHENIHADNSGQAAVSITRSE